MSKNIKIVIGANFGDEGKGLMTDYFSNKAEGSKIVVLYNGGAQRGHTVKTPSGYRHVFHHFGAGTLSGSDTLFGTDFLINPIIFTQEYAELRPYLSDKKIYRYKNCRVTTPYDMIANQYVEDLRGDNRHGSCGMGIYETIKRSESMNITLEDIIKDPIYFKYKISTFYIDTYPEIHSDLFFSDELLNHFIQDCKFMADNTIPIESDKFLNEYYNVIFEGAQGLCLDKDNTEYFPNLTPSNTGIKGMEKYLKDLDGDIEVCYVTRTYLTRHGAGKLPGECNKEDINPMMKDLTNHPNDYQGTLRYGKINANELLDRIKNDVKKLISIADIEVGVALTHKNEYFNESVPAVKYISDGEDWLSVKKL